MSPPSGAPRVSPTATTVPTVSKKSDSMIEKITSAAVISPSLSKTSVRLNWPSVDRSTALEKFSGQGYWQLDGAVAAENILIAAHALGLGAVWTAIYPYPERIPAVQNLLNLPPQVIPLTIIPMGYPAEKKMRENRFDASRVHYNGW